MSASRDVLALARVALIGSALVGAGGWIGATIQRDADEQARAARERALAECAYMAGAVRATVSLPGFAEDDTPISLGAIDCRDPWIADVIAGIEARIVRRPAEH